MNNVLQLKGEFSQKSSSGVPGPPKLPKNKRVSIKDLYRLKSNISQLTNYWKNQNLIKGALIDCFYTKVAAKSNRIVSILSYKNIKPNEMIVGARYREKDKISKHVITYFVPIDALIKSNEYLDEAIQVLKEEFDGYVTDTMLNPVKSLENIDFKKYNTFKTRFRQTIVDVCYIDRFDIPNNELMIESNMIVTIYKTNVNTKELLNKIGINLLSNRIIDDTTIYLDANDLKILTKKAPYLVSMATEDISKLSPDKFEYKSQDNIKPEFIPEPSNEPTIGVIDTLFDKESYFNRWVDSYDLLDENIKEPDDYKHGTTVSSIIVDGPHLNPELNDNCGRFKVRHFGVTGSKAFSSFWIIKKIEEIVIKNRDIHVWNLSLGSNDEVNNNFISAEGSVLDKIEFENDVIFVVAGTNKRYNDGPKKIGAPADSINSIVVNSVDFNNKPVEYSRNGIVLSFFTKPDVSYYGGSKDKYLTAFYKGKIQVEGTSYAAPWISRKLSYLIDIIGLNKETAKALIIDSATGWKNKGTMENLSLIGNGVVPIDINDILHSSDDEIRFMVSGISEKYDSYNYHLPVPMYKGKYPYVARATMCYFPDCSRNEGVDYTNVELDLHFGRINDKGTIKTINNNKQSIEGMHYLYEDDARRQFQKWDNVKQISEQYSINKKPKKVYNNESWGFSIKSKERFQRKNNKKIKFGIVVTLKEINGVNRIDDFIQQCSLNNWFVQEIDVDSKLDLYQTINEDLKLN